MKYDHLAINAIRALAIDMINKSKSGHIGMALDCAPLMYLLYTKYLVANPKDPSWIKRDRFVLSAGHASALLYIVLHLAGYGISLEDLKAFRQLNSITPGHPEYGHTPGVDCTSGPLGQGIAQAVGMAMAEKHLRAIYKESDSVLSHYTYCLCGDGCLEEGVSYEACALAGVQKLNKLILIYDANKATLDGPTSMSSGEDVLLRFKAAGWNTIEVKDGNDLIALSNALDQARASQDKPTLIKMNTLIGYGLAKQGTSAVHGALGSIEEGEYAKNVYGWNYGPFQVPQEVYLTFKESFGERGEKAYKQYQDALNQYLTKYPTEGSFLVETMKNDVSNYVFKGLPSFPLDKPTATRNVSNQMLNLLQEELPNLFGGSADVASSVKTTIKGAVDFTPEHPEGVTIRFGIREFAMGAIENGLLLHGGLRTYCGSFLVFTDYMKPAIRMAAMQKVPNIFLFSHDSIAVGEDGPTHQPIEQLAMLRSIPNLAVFRPADGLETAAAYQIAIRSTSTPTCLILTRQAVPNLPNSSFEGTEKGGYIISKEIGKVNALTLIASGSEVSLCIQAQQALLKENIPVRVVSLPEMNRFMRQPLAYRNQVLGKDRAHRLVVEMASSYGLSCLSDNIMSVDTFGASAPASKVMEKFGFTVENLVKRVKDLLKD